MDQILLNTSSQSDIDESESLFNISVQLATLEVPPSVSTTRKPSSPPAIIPVSMPLLPRSFVSSRNQVFSTPQPPLLGLWPHFKVWGEGRNFFGELVIQEDVVVEEKAEKEDDGKKREIGKLAIISGPDPITTRGISRIVHSFPVMHVIWM